MNRRQLEEYLRAHGCILHHHGAKHDVWINPTSLAKAPVPRHSQVKRNGTECLPQPGHTEAIGDLAAHGESSRRITRKDGVIEMPISRHEDWVQIAELDDQDQIRFTPEFRALMGDLGWEAKALVGHLVGLWYDPFEHLLDYTSGEASCSQDQPGQFDRNGLDEPQDVVEYWAVDWNKRDNCHEPPHRAGSGLGLSVNWYRDVLRAKLVSLRLPRRLLLEYKERIMPRGGY